MADEGEVQPTLQHRVDHLEGLVDLFTNFRTGKNNLARDEDEKHNCKGGDVSTNKAMMVRREMSGSAYSSA